MSPANIQEVLASAAHLQVCEMKIMYSENKLAKLRRSGYTSKIHFQHPFRGVRTLCNGPETDMSAGIYKLSKTNMKIIDWIYLASQIKSVVDLCSSYLESGLDLENCVDILSLADTFSLQKLRPQVFVNVTSEN